MVLNYVVSCFMALLWDKDRLTLKETKQWTCLSSTSLALFVQVVDCLILYGDESFEGIAPPAIQNSLLQEQCYHPLFWRYWQKWQESRICAADWCYQCQYSYCTLRATVIMLLTDRLGIQKSVKEGICVKQGNCFVPLNSNSDVLLCDLFYKF